MAEYGSQAAFLAAGGYHHHLGANIWQSAGAPSPPAGTAALRHATILLADEAERDAVLARVEQEGPFVEDPSGNRLLLEVA
jgi:catechol 2,3-dioxygenase